MTENQRYPSRKKRFWNAKTNGVVPIDLLVEWLAANYEEYFRANNVAEVLEEYRQKLLCYGIHGCTIDEIQSQITGIMSKDQTLQWLEPGRNGRSRMTILISWLGDNYPVYVRAKSTQVKDRLLGPVVKEILDAGFVGCTARGIRAKIEELKAPSLSPYLGSFKEKLSSIFQHELRKRAARRRGGTGTIVSSRKKRTNHQNQVTTCNEREGGSHVNATHSDDPPIKIERHFPDGSASAPLLVFGDAENQERGPSIELSIEEINRREALFDVRLKFMGKKTLPQADVDTYFPMPKV